MGFSYLGNKNWSQVTRDERTFCAELFMILQNQEKLRKFTKWLCKECKIENVDISGDIEIGFEVTFIRDILFDFELTNGQKASGKDRIKGALKRTLDLAIFLPNDIIVIEAKAAQSFTTKQMNDFKKDKEVIEKLYFAFGKTAPNVHLVGLVSSEYKPGLITQNNFENRIITWGQLENSGIGYSEPERLKKIYSNTYRIKRSPALDSKPIKDFIDKTAEIYPSRDI